MKNEVLFSLLSAINGYVIKVCIDLYNKQKVFGGVGRSFGCLMVSNVDTELKCVNKDYFLA